MSKELTNAQVEQIDNIHNIAYRAMAEVVGFDPDNDMCWEMEWIGELADMLAELAVKYFGKNEMEIYPYIEEIEEFQFSIP